jgi:hypothetical protein
MRINNDPILTELLKAKHELESFGKIEENKTISSQLIQQRKAIFTQLENKIRINNQDIRNYISDAELKESGEILLDAIENLKNSPAS